MPEGMLRREVLVWVVAAGAVLIAFGVTVLALNLTLYSAPSFVRSYLDALARQDAPAAAELAGDPAPSEASEALLTREALGTLDTIEVVANRTGSDGVHYVLVSYLANGQPGTTEFVVERSGTLFGLFNGWRFATPPYSVLRLTVAHDDRFTANQLDLVAQGGQDVAQDYLAFAPAGLRLSHDSPYLTANPVELQLSDPGRVFEATVDVRANEAFVTELQRQVDEHLDECATQAVLQPTGCPFGRFIENRVVSDPVWSIVRYPELTIRPGEAAATWQVPITDATAHLVVDVQSLFDGTISTTAEDVGFTVSYKIEFLPGDLLITANY